MKFAFLVGCIVLVTTSAFSQSVRTYSPVPSTKYVATTDVMDDVTKYYIHLKNTTGQDVNIGWKKISVDFPAGWDYSLCDYGTCYAGIPEGNHVMHSVEKDSSGFLAPNIYPYGINGTAVIRIAVWDKDNPSTTDTLTRIITAAASQADVHAVNVQTKELRLYPNPADGKVSIVFGTISTGTLSFINMKGISQMQLNVSNAKTFDADLSQLAAGEYVALFLNRDGSVLHSKLVKN